MVTKKDKKSTEELEKATVAKAIAAANKETEDTLKIVRKQLSTIEKETMASNFETRFKMIDVRINNLEGRK